MTTVEISEPLEGSKPGLRSIHNIYLDGKYVGYVDVGYLSKEDVKTFRKYTKRKLKAGQPFGVQLFIDAQKGCSVKELGASTLVEIIREVKKRFTGLEDRDIYVLELTKDGRKKPICRGENVPEDL